MRDMCKSGNEYVQVDADVEVRGVTAFALNVLCPDCEREFTFLPIHQATGVVYLPMHAPKAPAAKAGEGNE
jgi:hypothetical protein